MNRRMSISGFCCRLLVSALVLLLFAGVLAQELVITLELGTDRRDRPAITATVTDAAGTPLSQREVSFYFIPDFFPNEGQRLTGSRPVFLGSRKTNVVGQAQLTYAPPYTGRVEFEATVEASEGFEAGSGTLEADIVREEDPAPEPPEVPLAGIRRPLETAILTVVLGVWLVLLILTLSTFWLIYRRGREVTGGGAPRAAS